MTLFKIKIFIIVSLILKRSFLLLGVLLFESYSYSNKKKEMYKKYK
jgi:hypothetical protein